MLPDLEEGTEEPLPEPLEPWLRKLEYRLDGVEWELHSGFEKPVLRPEVVDDKSRVDLGGVRDDADRRALVASRGKGCPCRLQDDGPRVLTSWPPAAPPSLCHRTPTA